MSALVEHILSDPDRFLVAVFVASLLLCTSLAVGFAPTMDGNRRRMRRRIGRVSKTRSSSMEEQIESRVESLRRNDGSDNFAGLNRRLKQLLPNSQRLRMRLEQSGWRVSIVEYLIGCLVLGVAAFAAMTFAYGLPLPANLGIGIIIGVGAPHLIIGRRINKRVRKFTSLLPEAVDLIVRGVRSGLPVAEAIKVIGEEIDDPVGPEFAQISAQLSIGVQLDEALWALARRLQIQEFNFFVISLSIQQETGGNLAEVLDNLSQMIRRREQVRLKIKAMSSEARASAMIIGSLPFIMAGLLYVVNHDYIVGLFTDPRGWMLMGVGFTSLAMGIAVMAKMIRFEV